MTDDTITYDPYADLVDSEQEDYDFTENETDSVTEARQIEAEAERRYLDGATTESLIAEANAMLTQAATLSRQADTLLQRARYGNAIPKS